MTVTDPREDGRTARSRRTRTAVVDALLALQEEGNLAPTAQQVAARAGVALRTVFGHFSDMETLWAEAGQRELAALVELADDIPADLPLAERLERFAASRARVLEKLLPVMRAVRLREPSSPALAANRVLFIAAGEDATHLVVASSPPSCTVATRIVPAGCWTPSSSWPAGRPGRCCGTIAVSTPTPPSPTCGAA